MRLLKTLYLLVDPSGSQTTARRNAWAAMSECSARTRARREATAALAAVAGLGSTERRTADGG